MTTIQEKETILAALAGRRFGGTATLRFGTEPLPLIGDGGSLFTLRVDVNNEERLALGVHIKRDATAEEKDSHRLLDAMLGFVIVSLADQLRARHRSATGEEFPTIAPGLTVLAARG